jgi:hypothetical protein
MDLIREQILEIFAKHYPCYSLSDIKKVYAKTKSYDNTEKCLIDSWKLNQNPAEHASLRVWEP